MNNFQKSHAAHGMHFQSGTSVSDTGNYYGFLVIEEAVIATITYGTPNVNSGDITAITFPAGMYISLASNFTDITLTSGSMSLLKDK